ncbi:MAG: hypothetical protein K8R57_01265 [Verrucomicrobia bacterium]|nr:hypothetical protein [Verrucomicrobiota bacterium]
MATKKSSSANSAPTASVKKLTPTTAALSKGAAAVKSKATTRNKRTAGKITSKLAPSFTVDHKTSAKEPVISHDDIALRAYFIAERRQKMDWAGDSHTDWADALSQLRAEALEKPLKKR